MTDKQLKNALLDELVSRKDLQPKRLLEIFDNNQEKLNLVAKEFERCNLVKVERTDQNGVIHMSPTKRAKDFLDNGGF